MARLFAQKQFLYYPSKLELVRKIATWFRVEKKVLLVDPCAGRGDALAELARSFKIKPVTWGVEISYSRAEAARKQLDVVLNASFYEVDTDARWTPKSAGLIWNNPPYDWSQWVEKNKLGIERHIRHEWLFIDYSTPKIAPGGHHVVIIPRGMLGDANLCGAEGTERMARHLLGWFEKVLVYHDDNDDWERFNQIVVLALNKRTKFKAPTQEEIDTITAYADEATEIPLLPEGTGEYLIPGMPDIPLTFTYKPINPSDLMRLAENCSPVGSQEWRRATYCRALGEPFNPAMPLKIGHITMLISGQQAGVLALQDEDGRRMLVKGSMQKKLVEDAEDHYDDKGEYSSTRVKTKEKFITTLAIIYETGETRIMDESYQVGAFITKYADAIAEAILTKNPPLYDFMPTLEEMAAITGIGVGLPPLPGRAERGLFLAQKHLALAGLRVLNKHHNLIVNAEMGTGKTILTVAMITGLGKWPVVIDCPGHMVWKWFRDIRAGCDPDRPIVPRVITRPVSDAYFVKAPKETKGLLHIKDDLYMANAPQWLHIKQDLEAFGKITYTARLQVEPVSLADCGGRRHVVLECPDTSVAARAVAYLMRYGFKDRQAKTEVKAVVKMMGTKIDAVIYDRDDYTLQDFYDDYNAGKLGTRAAAISGMETFKFDAGWDTTEYAGQWQWVKTKPEEYKETKVKHYRLPICTGCGRPINWLGPTGRNPEFFCRCSTKKGKQEKFWKKRTTAGYQFSRWRRTGLARLIQGKYKGFFKTYVVDELHKAKSGTTDIGVGDQRALSGTEYSIALTGTLFGGMASSLFHLLYRRLPGLRDMYRQNDIGRWITNYGLKKESWTQHEPYVSGTAKSTNIKRINCDESEIPGVSPAVTGWLLPITIFANITDLGYELPELHEHIKWLDMDPAQSNQYAFAYEYLLEAAKQLIHEKHDKGGLSTWVTTARYRAMSCFRDEFPSYESKKHPGHGFSLHLPAVVKPGEWLPKEKALAELIWRSADKGEKALVFVEQTGTRDIRDRLVDAVTTLAPRTPAHLLEIGTLSSSLAPQRREMWIRSKAPSLAALLVNATLVETGLDLVMFSRLIFYETTTNLYTLWQGMRRVWRLGQDKNVGVTFMAYRNTMEESILKRIGAKMKYGKLLYGETAAGALVDNSDDDDVEAELIRRALEGKGIAAATMGEMVTEIFGASALNAEMAKAKSSGILLPETEIVTPTVEITLPATEIVLPTPVETAVITSTAIPSGETATIQFPLFPGFDKVAAKKRKKSKDLPAAGQYTLF